MAIAWLLHRPTVASVVIGARTAEQLEENMRAVQVQLSQEEVDTPSLSYLSTYLFSLILSFSHIHHWLHAYSGQMLCSLWHTLTHVYMYVPPTIFLSSLRCSCLTIVARRRFPTHTRWCSDYRRAGRETYVHNRGHVINLHLICII